METAPASRPTAARRHAGFPHHALIAVDGTPEGVRAARFAARLLTASGGHATVLAVVVLPPSLLDAVYEDGVAEALVTTVRDMTAASSAACRAAGVEATVDHRRVTTASIGHEIADVAADRGCDLIVVGSHPRRTLGSVVGGVVTAAHCPVLVVPEPPDEPRETRAAQPRPPG